MPSKIIVVCTPTVDGKYEHGMELSLTQAMFYLGTKGWSTIRHHARGSNIGCLRDMGVGEAMKANADYVLQVDSDTVIASNAYDSIERLINRDLDIVSGVYVGKQGEFVPIAAQHNGESYETLSDVPTDGSLVEVDSVGAGFLLVKTEVFSNMQPPYFEWLTGYPNKPDRPFSLRGCRNEDTLQNIKVAAGEVESWMKQNPDKGLVDVPITILRDFLMRARYAIPGVQHGEDYGFCHKAKVAGYKIWLDTSVLLGHIGSYIYTINDFWANKAYRESQNEHSKTKDAGIVTVGV